MLRREIRERRELLLRKKKEHTQSSLQERREFSKNATDKGNQLPYSRILTILKIVHNTPTKSQ
jgi:hypothetical protein